MEEIEMEIWPLILYVAASLFALRSLISLMTQHKRTYTQQLIAEEVAR